MADQQNFKVVRPHVGDRAYARGDIRTGSMSELRHLVPRVLEPLAVQVDDLPDTKAEGAAPANKAAKGRKAETKAQGADEGEKE